MTIPHVSTMYLICFHDWLHCQCWQYCTHTVPITFFVGMRPWYSTCYHYTEVLLYMWLPVLITQSVLKPRVSVLQGVVLSRSRAVCLESSDFHSLLYRPERSLAWVSFINLLYYCVFESQWDILWQHCLSLFVPRAPVKVLCSWMGTPWDHI